MCVLTVTVKTLSTNDYDQNKSVFLLSYLYLVIIGYSVFFDNKFHVVTYISEWGVSIAAFDNVVHMHICLSNRWRKCLRNIKNFMVIFMILVPFLNPEAIKILRLRAIWNFSKGTGLS
jgi:hypothetical protein